MKIAITGGIGTGKSTFSKIVSENGYKVIDADKVAKTILEDDDKVKNEIIESFGVNSFKNGRLNVKFLAEKVFIKKENVKKINSIVHPPTIKRIENLMDEALNNENLVFCEAALIYESNMDDLFDYVIVVDCDEQTKIDRVIKRDDVSEDEIRNRMENQISDKDKKGMADFVISNNGTFEELRTKTDFLLNLLKNLSNKG